MPLLSLEIARDRLATQPDSLGNLAVSDLAKVLADGLVIPTSGSEGIPKLVVLPQESLTASITATAGALGVGHWLLALPLTHIAGWMVVARACAASTQLVSCDASCSPAAFSRAVVSMPPGSRFTALVPTQLGRLLADPEAAHHLATFDSVLVGGAACPRPLRDAAAKHGVRLVRTYGMTETAGGCVYDGVPLPGVSLEVAESGRISLGGDMVAAGYAGAPSHEAFSTENGRRWHHTSDHGQLEGDVIRVLGRLDDVIVTGGENVHPLAIESALADHLGIGNVAIVGAPHPHWGEAVVLLTEQEIALDAVKRVLHESLPASHAPKAVVTTPIPRTPTGKVDRAAARAIAAQHTVGW